VSNLGVDNIKGSDGISGPSITGNVVFSGTSHIVLPKGTTAERPTGVAAGSLRFNTDTKLVEQYNGVEWVTLNSYGVGRGVFGGGSTVAETTLSKTVDYITIVSQGTNASDFGDLIDNRLYGSSCSSSTRGVFAWGESARSPVFTLLNAIEYITISTTGNSTIFGSVVGNTTDTGTAFSSSTRGIFKGNGGGIYYITFSSTGDILNFGSATTDGAFVSGCSSSTRGVFGGGAFYSPTYDTINAIEYVTIATTGNSTDFGDLTRKKTSAASCSSSTRGVFGGGYYVVPTFTQIKEIDYITIATTGNALNFGNLIANKVLQTSCSSSTRGVFGGGESPSITNVIEYITIASQGTDAQDFGDLTEARQGLSACSDAHGGLS